MNHNLEDISLITSRNVLLLLLKVRGIVFSMKLRIQTYARVRARIFIVSRFLLIKWFLTLL